MAAERDEDRPSRGRPARLSRAAIAAAARSVVARDGVDGLTMRTLAAELGGSPPALYRHVSGREEVLALLLAQLAEELPRPPLPEAPRPRLLAVCALMHDWLAERPWAIEVVAADAMPVSVAWLVEEIAGALVALGLDDPAAIAGYEAISFAKGDDGAHAARDHRRRTTRARVRDVHGRDDVVVAARVHVGP
jgi:AcrR family transcriptional regulator